MPAIPPVAVVVELVVGAECEERPDAHPIRVEDLGAAVDPALAVGQPVPVRREQELDAVEGALQRQRLARQDGQDDVGEHGREPHDLEVARYSLAEIARATIRGGNTVGDLFGHILQVSSSAILSEFCRFYWPNR